MSTKDYLISAIVSVYNCEQFIAGCLEDLEQQTIPDKLEIIVVNSGSQQNEEPIIKEFQKKYDNIVYIKTENRETIYKAWNRGINIASGEYITNANVDDRHRRDAFEIMADVLKNNRDIDIVYADDIITETENETLENCTPVGYSNWPEFDPHKLIFNCYIGPHPMWRKRLHGEYGYFDENFEVAGDYDFWLRIAVKCKFKHVNNCLGLYLRRENSAGHRESEVTMIETLKVRSKYILNLKGIKKITHLRHFLVSGLLYSVTLSNKNLSEVGQYCDGGVWGTIKGIKDPWNRNIKMPYIIKKIFYWHPYFWAGLIRCDLLGITSEILKRIKEKNI
jgi:glycosyltransferase involved in cell wall biosynthesis